jgi:hypothetical protein
LNTLQKVFQVSATTATGFLNDAANPTPDGSFDLSDMFKPGVIPKNIPNVRVTVSAVTYNWESKTATQTITVTNLLSSTILGPINIALDDLTPGVTLINSNGSSSNEEEESPFITVAPANSSLAPSASASVTLQFKVPDFTGFAYDVREVFQQ